MSFVYKENELPVGTICTQRLHNLIKFSEYKKFIFKCKTYCDNRGIDLNDYIDNKKFLVPHATKIFFLPIDLAIGIIENVRMHNINRGTTLEYLYKLKGEKMHVQLQERKADSVLDIIAYTLKTFAIDSYKEYTINNKYRIDLYIPTYNLAIEYDEYHHAQQAAEDEIRESYIKTIIGCEFIRLQDADSMSINISKVLSKCLMPVALNEP